MASSSTGAHAKRPAARREAADSDSDDEHDASHRPTAPPPKKQRARASHGGGGTSSQLVSQATEIQANNVRAPPTIVAPVRNINRSLENGTLLRIRLQNFKSHQNFSMDFGPVRTACSHRGEASD